MAQNFPRFLKRNMPSIHNSSEGVKLQCTPSYQGRPLKNTTEKSKWHHDLSSKAIAWSTYAVQTCFALLVNFFEFLLL
jgi:hypothetical protein